TRKIAHVTEYSLLAALWFVALTRERGLPRRRAAWVALGVAVVWAVLDELHQATVPSRTASAMDVALDSTGAMAAAVVGRYGGSRVLEVAAFFFLWAAAAGGAVNSVLRSVSSESHGELSTIMCKHPFVRDCGCVRRETSGPTNARHARRTRYSGSRSAIWGTAAARTSATGRGTPLLIKSV